MLHACPHVVVPMVLLLSYGAVSRCTWQHQGSGGQREQGLDSDGSEARQAQAQAPFQGLPRRQGSHLVQGRLP